MYLRQKAGNLEEIEALLADGVPVDVVDEQGYTPLYCATMYEREEAVVALLAAGAEVDKVRSTPRNVP